MKSEYRYLIELIIEKKQKLAEAREMQVGAKDKFMRANECVASCEASLKESEMKLAELEQKIFGLEA
ncbi:hypothetical protein [Pseudomonas chlororaphis]|uniref:hypothetical protein n=1 Tax=Pseudomonas chlororaphis TaxID=587753 RepID=UPI0039E0D881